MKKTFLLMNGLFFAASSHAQLLNVLKSTVKNSTAVDVGKITSKTDHQTTSATGSETVGSLTSSEISSGLKEVLNIGVQEGVKKLSAEDGFYKNSVVKILMPEKLRNIESKLRLLGYGQSC